MARSSEIRKMNGVQHAVSCLDYPYGYIGQDDYGCDYALEDILRPMPAVAEEPDVGDFPKNIAEHYWVRPGQNDGDSWMSCGVLTNGSFFFYRAGCDYTGFGCQGGMSLWVSASWATIVNHAMGQADYDLFVEQTAVPPAEGEAPWPELTEEAFWAERRAQIRCYQCGEKGATHEHPYSSSDYFCDACWAAENEDAGEEEAEGGQTAFDQVVAAGGGTGGTA